MPQHEVVIPYIVPSPITYLKTKNAHPFDKRIQFDEGPHTYYITEDNGRIVNDYVSASGVIQRCFKKDEFNKDAVATKILKSPKMKDPEYKYYGQTKEQIMAQWDGKGAELGTALHLDVEYVVNGHSVKNKSKEFQYFLDFQNDYPQLTPYRSEWEIFDQKHRLCGSIDMIYYDELEKRYVMYDWKRVGDLYKEDFNYKFSHIPFMTDIPNTPYHHYCVQLNVYKKILVDNYGIDIGDMYLLVLHPNNESYQRVKIEDLDIIDELFQYRLDDKLVFEEGQGKH